MPEQEPSHWGRRLVVTILIIAGMLFVWSLFNPQADVPGISPFVCSVKGGSWHVNSGGFDPNPTGCYETTGGN